MQPALVSIKNKTVNVPLPLNLTEPERKWFAPYSAYEYTPQKIKYFKNAFLGFSGFALNRQGLLKECHHQYPSQHADYLSEAASYYHAASDHPENLVTLNDNNIYLAIHHPWFNYYHWVCESIFRLWLVRKKLDKLVLVLPDFYEDADFIRGTLEPFNIKHIYFIPREKSLLVRNLCLPELKQVCDSYNRLHLRQVRRFYRDYVLNQKKIPFTKISRLYVSRKLAGRRQVKDEEQILKVLDRHDFTIFYPEKFSFLEQVAIFSQVNYLVGTHGSGLTNMLFMANGSSLLELHQNKTNELDHPSPLFWYMAEGLGINYYHQCCTTHGKEDYFDGEYIIDPIMLDKNLHKMLYKNEGGNR